MTMMEHFFTTYVRTKTLFKHRLNDLKDYTAVKIYIYELNKLGVNNGPLLYHLKEKGEISYDKDGNFKALRDGPIDYSLLERTRKRDKTLVELTPLHLYMRDQLRYVDLKSTSPDVSVYFKAFMEHRDRDLEPFFTVDSFSGRVHTPVVNLKTCLRHDLKLCGSTVVSLDVKQMQPTILAKVLLDTLGTNSFSTEIFNGVDVYVLLQKSAGLPTRAEAKLMLFRLIFGKPMNDIGKVFKGDTAWVDWINSYKSRTEPNNPHKEDKHTNLAWLLQFSEVQVMSGMWEQLMVAGIPFLTIHDDILCRVCDKDRVYDIMNRELMKHFPRFTITINHGE